MKVMATNASKVYNIAIKELGRIAVPGEVFDVTKARYKVLAGENKYGFEFVRAVAK